MKPDLRLLSGGLIALLLVCTFASGAAARGGARQGAYLAELAGKRNKLLLEAGTRHAKVGVWCRDAGLVAQASAEFIKAVEVSEGKNQWAQRILMFMRRLDDKFWKKKLKKPSAGMIRAYETRARKAHTTYQKERLKLARWAHKKKLPREALAEYKAVVRLSDDYVHVNEKGLVVLDVGTVPEAYSKQLLEDAITVNGKPRIRDAFLELVPGVDEVHEAANDRMLVRSQVSKDQAESFLAMCTALLPYLEKDMGGRPTRRLRMFIFKERKTYAGYCDSAGLGSHKKAAGLADGGTFVTLVNAEGWDDETVRGIALHELTHLFQYGVSPTVMPSWYNEGFAETYGGDGTFKWDGEKLEAGGLMNAALVHPLKDDANFIPLVTLLTSDALTLINAGEGKAPHFYHQSWAFLRYLRTAAGDDIRDRFARYELVCLGAALGAEAGKPHNRNATDSQGYFRRLFGADLDTLEAGFREWLASYEGP